MWRKILFIAGFIISIVPGHAQQSSFGFTAGYLNVELELSDQSNNISEHSSGFYLGAVTDISLSEAFQINFGVAYGNSDDTGFLFIPLMAKYFIAESGIYVQAGPQASFIFKKNDNANFQTLGADIGFGAGYNINNNLFMEAKYFLGLTNRLEGLSETSDLKMNTLMLGLGYKI